jgi:hypothetical protein
MNSVYSNGTGVLTRKLIHIDEHREMTMQRQRKQPICKPRETSGKTKLANSLILKLQPPEWWKNNYI